MTLLRKRQWSFHFFPYPEETTGNLVCVSSPNCLRDDCGASSQPALCIPYVPAMSTHCRGGQEYAVFGHAMVVLHLSESVYQARNPSADSRDWPTRWMTLGGRRAVGATQKSIPVSGRPGGICTATERRLHALLRVTFLVAAAIKITIV